MTIDKREKTTIITFSINRGRKELLVEDLKRIISKDPKFNFSITKIISKIEPKIKYKRYLSFNVFEFEILFYYLTEYSDVLLIKQLSENMLELFKGLI
jgi:hypothetical protein